mgnify:CR=1 FL=1
MTVELQVAEAAGWRALLTCGQQSARTFLPPEVERHLVSLLYRRLGSAVGRNREQAMQFARQLVADTRSERQDLAAVGEHCLLFSGLFPDHAPRHGMTLACFVQTGQQAWRDHAARVDAEESARYRLLADQYIRMLDVLLAVHEMSQQTGTLDALSAWSLWHDTGSAHGWQVLRRLTPSLPGEPNLARH